jgi:hypothetical protein
MINFKLTVCIVLISLCAEAQQNLKNLLKNTNWIQEGYGRYLKIDDSTYTYYNTNQTECKKLVEGKFSGRFKVVSLNKDKLILNPGGIVNYHFKRIDSLPSTCRTVVKMPTSYEENFKVFWETFHDNYAFFRERNLNWKQVYKNYLPRVRKIRTEKEFADILLEIVKKIGDGHIRMEIPDSLKTKIVVKNPGMLRKKDNIIMDIQDRYLTNVQSYNDGVIKWGKIKNSKIGYVLIKDMNNFSDYIASVEQHHSTFTENYDKVRASKEALVQFDDECAGVDKIMEKVLNDIGQSDSMVIDLRFNGGGLETVALKLLSYFVNENKPVLSIKAKTPFGYTTQQEYILQKANKNYKGKVYLLLSAGTASAAEIFALGAHGYPNIITIGSSTAGIFSEILWKELPNGWEFSLSNEIYTDPNGKTYEGIGLPVNYELNYPRNRTEFYNSFYVGGYFTDLALDKISGKVSR